MSFIEQLQKLPQSKKVRIIWTAAIIATIILIGVWIVSEKFHKNTAKDTSLFQTISKGIKDVRNSYHK